MHRTLLLLIAFACPVLAYQVHPDGSITLTNEERATLVAEIQAMQEANAEMYAMLVQQQKKLETCKPVRNL